MFQAGPQSLLYDGKSPIDMSDSSGQLLLFERNQKSLSHPDRPKQIGQATVNYQSAREILTRATGFMDAYDYTLNPYSGCSFGCTYCYAAFFSSAKRDSWGRWVSAKDNAEALLSRHRGKLDGKLIYMSSVTDPYQPIERKLKLTRRLLAVIANAHCPRLVVQTRSPDVVRDIDLFQRIHEGGGRVQINITITTDDEDIRQAFEPWCPSNANRLQAACKLRNKGVQTCITMTPLLLVRNPVTFADDLLNTGVKKFIVQPFHFQRGKFVAGTRDEALSRMAEKLESKPKEFLDCYLTHYQKVKCVLKDRLPELGEGKEGFKPPF